VELDGADHLPWVGDTDTVVASVERFVRRFGGQRHPLPAGARPRSAELPASFGPKTSTPEEGVDDTFILYATRAMMSRFSSVKPFSAQPVTVNWPCRPPTELSPTYTSTVPGSMTNCPGVLV
jgi:hypothetical protein